MALGPGLGVLAWKRSDGSAESVAGITVFTVGAGCGRTRSEMMTISQMTSAIMTIPFNARSSSGFILSDSILPPIQYPCHRNVARPPLPGARFCALSRARTRGPVLEPSSSYPVKRLTLVRGTGRLASQNSLDDAGCAANYCCDFVGKEPFG
jgi:hypothetical protein